MTDDRDVAALRLRAEKAERKLEIIRDLVAFETTHGDPTTSVVGLLQELRGILRG